MRGCFQEVFKKTKFLAKIIFIRILHSKIFSFSFGKPDKCYTHLIITQEPPDRFSSNFYWGTQKNHGNFLSLGLRFEVEWVDFYSENLVLVGKHRPSAGKRGSQASIIKDKN